ncbi:MAG: hypothetical protein WCJ81_01540 [bacterium]
MLNQANTEPRDPEKTSANYDTTPPTFISSYLAVLRANAHGSQLKTEIQEIKGNIHKALNALASGDELK